MTLPNFLGIGAQRSGTSWLDVQLRTHPQVYLPVRRKEVHYFDEFHDRGPQWYREFFPGEPAIQKFAAIGEITPKYLFHPQAAERIHALLPNCKLIAILRNPADRAFSQYGLSVKNHGERRSFEEFVAERSEAFERGLYAAQLRRFFDRFPRENICVLIFERTVAGDRTAALARVAGFLGVDPRGFQTSAAETELAVAGSHLTRFPRARAAASSLALLLRRHDLDGLVNLAKRAGIPQWFGSRGPLPKLNPATRAQLLERYEPDIRAVEQLLGEDLSLWRQWPLPAQTDCDRNAA